jgi:hypothetical protein
MDRVAQRHKNDYLENARFFDTRQAAQFWCNFARIVAVIFALYLA